MSAVPPFRYRRRTPIGPLFLGADSLGLTHTVTISSSGSLASNDFGTLRARAGYVLGNFMPYGFAGLALTEATVSIASNVHDIQCNSATPPACGSFFYSNAYNANAQILYGLATGGGVDWALTPNIFLRAAGPVVHACHRPRRRRLQVLKTDDRQRTTDDG